MLFILPCICIFVCLLNCQLPSCNLFTQHLIVLWRDTSSELWTPVLLFIIVIQPAASCFPVFFTPSVLFPFDTINLLFSARPVGLTTSMSSWGKVIWLCCAGLYFKSWCHSLSPTGRLNLGLITEGNSCCCLHHHLPLGVSQLDCLGASKNFWRRCRGTNEALLIILPRQLCAQKPHQGICCAIAGETK